MSKTEIVGAVAKAAIATVAGGPIGGATKTADQAVDLLLGWLDREHGPTYRSTLNKVSRGLHRWARSERIPDHEVEQALLQAERSILKYGLAEKDIAARNLDAEMVAQSVLSRSAAEIQDLDEAARGVCRRAVQSVYSTLLRDPEALPGLQRAFQAAALTRLAELKDQPLEVLQALRSALAIAAVVDHRRIWRPDLYPPGALLRAEFEIVPFYGRRETLADLEDWVRSDAAIGIRLYTGAGGMGKTRLMIRLCAQVSDPRCRAGFLNRILATTGWISPVDAVFEATSRLLIVVDYAETRCAEVAALVRRAQDRTTANPIRIVLLARDTGDWWTNLCQEGDGVGDLLTGPPTRTFSLTALAPDPAQRRRVFEHAAAAFGEVVRDSKLATPPPLDATDYDRVFFILLRALAAVHGEAIEGERELLDWALKRERRFLDHGVEALGMPELKGRPILQCTAVATLADSAYSRQDAVRLLSHAPLLAGQPAAVVDKVADLLHRLYPGDAWLQGVQPDLLGEHLLEHGLADDQRMLQAMFGQAE